MRSDGLRIVFLAGGAPVEVRATEAEEMGECLSSAGRIARERRRARRSG